RAGHSGPALAVERQAQNELVWGRALRQVGPNGEVVTELLRRRVTRGAEQRRLMVGGRLPGTVQVVALKCRKVEILEDLLDFEASGNLGRISWEEGGKQVVLVRTSPERV